MRCSFTSLLVALFGVSVGQSIALAQVAQPPSLEVPAAPDAVSAAPVPVPANQLTFYGFFRLDTVVSDSQLNHPQYSMWAASEPGGARNNGLIDIYPRLTRFGLKVHRDSIPRLGNATLDGNLEIDFQNRAVGEASGGSESRETPRLRHGYFKLGIGNLTVLAGQTWDLIAPLWPIVNADAMMWNSGNLGDRRPQIRLSYEPATSGSTKLQFQLALARSGAVDLKDADANSVRDGDASMLPMVQGRFGVVSLLDRLDVGVWGHYGREKAGSVPKQPGSPSPGPVTSGRTEFACYSIGGDLNLKRGPVTVSGEAFWGRNLSDVRGGIGQGIGKVSGEEIEARGGWANVRVSVAPWLALGAGGAIDDVATKNLVAGDRRRNLAAFGNVEADAGGGFVVGLDYIRWLTDYVDKPQGTANRLNLYAMYKF